MKSKEAVNCLNDKVLFGNPKLYMENREYILRAVVLRKDENGYFYQAEIQDTAQPKSVMICRLEDIERIKIGDASSLKK